MERGDESKPSTRSKREKRRSRSRGCLPSSSSGTSLFSSGRTTQQPTTARPNTTTASSSSRPTTTGQTGTSTYTDGSSRRSRASTRSNNSASSRPSRSTTTGQTTTAGSSVSRTSSVGASSSRRDGSSTLTPSEATSRRSSRRSRSSRASSTRTNDRSSARSSRGSTRSGSRSSRGRSSGRSPVSQRSALDTQASSRASTRVVAESFSTPDAGTQRHKAQYSNGLYVLRPGEDMNTAFPNWTRHAVDKYGEYEAKDLNHPSKLPARKGGLAAHALDPPLTHVGLLQAKLIARGIKHSFVRVSAVYSSPSLRCITTAAHMVKGLSDGGKIKIRVEPGLFEWQGWHVECPSFLNAGEAVKAGFPVDPDYKPVLSHRDLLRARNETVPEAYTRIAKSLHAIMGRERQRTKAAGTTTGSNVLVIAHSIVLDAAHLFHLASAPTTGHLRRSRLEMLPDAYPPGSIVHLRSGNGKSEWAPFPCPVPALTSLTFSNATAPLPPQTHHSTKSGMAYPA